jgi:lysophospholipase L1-like esterase
MKRMISPILSLFRVLFLLVITNTACKSGLIPQPAGEPPRFITRLDSFRIDGDPGEWPDSLPVIRILSDVSGNVPDTSDLSACFRLAWNRYGLLVLAEITDDSVYEDPERFWNGDGMELFISPTKGSLDIVQFSVRPSFDLPDSDAAVIYYDHRRSGTLLQIPPAAIFRSCRIPSGYRLEGMIPLGVLGINEPVPGTDMAIQLYINDSDREKDSSNYSLPWYPVRDSYRNPYAFFPVRFTLSAIGFETPEVRAYVLDNKSLFIKILSHQPPAENKFLLVSGNVSGKFSLFPGEHGLYDKQLEFPLKKIASGGQALQFLLHDSLFFSIDPILLHRVYKDAPTPNRFEDEIRIYEIIDHFRPPPQHAFLFTGSSTIRRWTDIGAYLPGITLLNRGFGGSTMKDLNHFAERIVFPYNPSRVFVYEGDNDLGGGTAPGEFINDCREFIEACSKRIPDAEIWFLSIKPSLARIRKWDEMQAANRMLKDLADRYDKVHFIDISEGMLDPKGMPRKDIFVEDGLHLNAEGYGILARAIRPAVYE